MFPIHNAVPTRFPAVVTWALIAVNCVVFLIQLDLDHAEHNAFLLRYALIPAHYFDPTLFGENELTPDDFVPFVTMMFLHGGWLHLILNMWTLWLFGPAVEDRLGHGRYLAFYLVCGIAAAVAHAVLNPTSTVPALGASGAIAGVLGAYTRFFPLSRVIVVVPILFIPLFFELHAFVFIGFWFLLQLLQAATELLTPSVTGGVAWWAHIGGFIVGLALAPWLRQAAAGYRVYYPDEGELGFDPRGRP
jgi:membrane associated rhomboid family serine protease